MTTYYADASNGVGGFVTGTATNFPGPVVLEGGKVIAVVFQFTLPDNSGSAANTFAFTTADSLALVNVPAGSRILNYVLNLPAFGAGLTINVGVTGTLAAFISAGTGGVAGGLVSPFNAPNGLVAGAVPSAETPIANPGAWDQTAEKLMGVVFGIVPQASLTTPVAIANKKVTGYLMYTMQDQTVFGTGIA